MKTIARLGLLALLLSIVWAACTHDPDVPPRPAPKPDTTAVDSALLGKWYLAGLGRVGDTTVTPIDSVSYALEIWREGFLYGHYVNGSYTWGGDTIHIKLNAEDEKRMPEQIRRYREALLGVVSYRVDNEHQMRLFYDRGQRYLLFRDQPTRPSKQAIVPQDLLTTWIFRGYVQTKDGKKTLLRNIDIAQLRFNADTTWVLQFLTGQLTGSFRTDGQSMYFTITPPSLRKDPNEAYYLRQALERVTSYKIHGNELRLYEGGEETYVTFQKAEIGTGRINEHLCRPWKLIGFGHTADGSVQIPKEGYNLREQSFMLEFRVDGSLYTHSSTNMFNGDYSMDGQSLHIALGAGTKVNETKDGLAYIQALHAAERFELQKDGHLKLFYNQGRDYLLFREGISIISSTPPAELLGKWVMTELRRYAMPPIGFKLSEQTVDFRSDGFVYITGTEPFGTSLGNKLPYGYQPWGKEDNLLVGYMYFSCRIDGDELRLGRNSSVDGPVYVFKRLRK